MTKLFSRGLLLLIVAAIGWFAVVRPQMKVFGQRSLDAKVRSEEEYSYEQRVKDIDFIKEKGDAVQKILTAEYLAMPRSAQIPEVLVMVESLANSSGIVFSSANVGAPSGNEVPVSVSFNANLSSFNTFLNALNNNIRTVIIKDQTVTADKSGNLGVTMQLGLLYQGGK